MIITLHRHIRLGLTTTLHASVDKLLYAVNSAHYFISHLRHVWIIQSELQIPKWKKRRNIQTSILPSRRWLGDGEMKRRRLMGKRYTLGGENAPGGLYWFLPLKRFIMYVIYLCILFLYNINQSSEVDAQNSVHIKQFVLSNIYSFNTERGAWDKQKKHMWFERMNTKCIGI